MERITAEQVQNQRDRRAKADELPTSSATFPYPITERNLASYRAEIWNRPMEATCPNCAGLGFLKVVSPLGKAEVQSCPTCNTEKRVQWLRNNCGLTGQELGYTLHHWGEGNWSEAEADKRQQRIEAYRLMAEAVTSRKGLYTFWGDFGSGKSFALQIMTNQLRDQMIEAYYSTFSALLDHIRSSYGSGQDTNQFWDRLLNIPALFIDEVTRFNETPWARERLFLLIDTRYRKRDSHLTAFSTNDDPNELLSTGEDIGYMYSRMRSGQLVELRGDMRSQDDAEFVF